MTKAPIGLQDLRKRMYNADVLSTGGKTFTYDSENHMTSMTALGITTLPALVGMDGVEL